jgi:hypothetical protein
MALAPVQWPAAVVSWSSAHAGAHGIPRPRTPGAVCGARGCRGGSGGGGIRRRRWRCRRLKRQRLRWWGRWRDGRRLVRRSRRSRGRGRWMVLLELREVASMAMLNVEMPVTVSTSPPELNNGPSCPSPGTAPCSHSHSNSRSSYCEYRREPNALLSAEWTDGVWTEHVVEDEKVCRVSVGSADEL